MRMKLWPESTEVEHEEEMEVISSGACFDDELEWYVNVAYERTRLLDLLKPLYEKVLSNTKKVQLPISKVGMYLIISDSVV